jgi:predicted aconitase with swiveling domain
MIKKINGQIVAKGIGNGKALVTHQPLSFLGDVSPKDGLIQDPKQEVYGESIAGKVLVFPQGKGSTVGSYIMYQLKRNGKAPTAIINVSSETIVAVGAIISNIPLIHKLEVDPLRAIKSGSNVLVNCIEGFVEVET